MQRKEYGILEADGHIEWISKSALQEIYTDDTIKAVQINNNLCSSDIYMYYCGIENCIPGHKWGPVIKDHYLIHYIFEGEGRFSIHGKTYHLTKSQGFIIYPYTSAFYEADMMNPWKYAWVGFHGLNAGSYLNMSGLIPEFPVFTFNRGEKLYSCMLNMVNVFEEYRYGTSLRLQALLYMFFSELIENAKILNEQNKLPSTQELYVQKTVDYISKNYAQNISIAQIASYIGLDRSYLTTIFKRYLNVSPLLYIIQYRISKACELLKDPTLSICEIASLVGYKDFVVFRKVFKKFMGVPPKEYRKLIL